MIRSAERCRLIRITMNRSAERYEVIQVTMDRNQERSGLTRSTTLYEPGHRKMNAAHTIVWVVSITMGLLVACADPETSGDVDAGSADAASLSACDRIGVCGDSEEPACQGCAVDGPCAEAWDACHTDPTGSCVALAECHVACPLEDTGCYDACDDATSLEAVVLLAVLTGCVFCQQCPESCRVDTSQCL